MARARSSTVVLALGLLLMTLAGECYGKLQVGFYNKKCGKVNVEAVIFAVVKKHFLKDKDTVADLVRLQFHDCFVRVSGLQRIFLHNIYTFCNLLMNFCNSICLNNTFMCVRSM